MKKIIATSIILIIAPLLFLKIASAQLLTDTEGMSQVTNEVAASAGIGNIDLGTLIANVIRIILGFLGVIFLVLLILSGFRWMTSGGNEEAVKHAQGSIKAAIIGLVIVLAAYSITYFVFRWLPFSGSTTPQTQTGDKN